MQFFKRLIIFVVLKWVLFWSYYFMIYSAIFRKSRLYTLSDILFTVLVLISPLIIDIILMYFPFRAFMKSNGYGRLFFGVTILSIEGTLSAFYNIDFLSNSYFAKIAISVIVFIYLFYNTWTDGTGK